MILKMPFQLARVLKRYTASMRTMEDRGDLTSRLTIGFRVLPNYGNDVRRQYNNLLVELAKGDLLSHILSMVLNRPVSVGKLDADMWKDVAQTNYALS